MNFKLSLSVFLVILWLVNSVVPTTGEDNEFVFAAGSSPDGLRMEVAKRKRYLLYEVNHGEGFNLRRDVYMRVANLVQKLRQHDDWILVLPPWGPLYHWKSSDLGKQTKIPWSQFFEVESLGKHVPVLELEDFIRECGSIDLIYSLQYFADTFKEGTEWEEKYEEAQCLDPASVYYHYDKQQHQVQGWFWGYDNIVARNFSCLSLQGHASTLAPLLLLKNVRSIMLDRAEIMLHDSYGDATYWLARRSMRFAKRLRNAGDHFRREHLNSTDFNDGTDQNDDWTQMKPARNSAKGGPYIGVHLRREDFLHGRQQHVPSLVNAAEQIKTVLVQLNLTRVFVATDASQREFAELQSYLPSAIRYAPSALQKAEFKDGGIAIIDQWICAHSRYFIGTYESTFSFRIQEEREILGFNPDTTFNRLCGNNGEECDTPTRWQIVY